MQLGKKECLEEILKNITHMSFTSLNNELYYCHTQNIDNYFFVHQEVDKVRTTLELMNNLLVCCPTKRIMRDNLPSCPIVLRKPKAIHNFL